MKVKEIKIYEKVLSHKEGNCYLLADVIGNIEDLKQLQKIIVDFSLR